MPKSHNTGGNKASTLPSLPTEAVARDGFRFKTDGEIWFIHSQSAQTKLNFRRYIAFSPELLHSFKLVILWYVENKSLSHVNSICDRLAHFTDSISTQPNSIQNFSSENIINYRASLGRRTEWYLSTISGALKKWHALGFPGVDRNAVKILNELRLRGNITGEAVRTMDPKKGPFSDVEFESIHCAANNAYANGIIPLEDYVLIWLFSALGARSVQYASLKVKDFKILNDKTGAFIYTLKIPRAKQRDSNSRDYFTERSLIPQIGELLSTHIESIKPAFSKKISDLGELPIFPTSNTSFEIPGFAFHPTGKSLSDQLKATLAKLNVISERTGEKIKVTSRRFRYTLGTRAAMEGAGELIIAELLDHTTTQYAGVYVEARPEIVERIDKAIALQMAPMAQAFCGMLINNEKEADRGDNPASRIINNHENPRREPVGNCGKHGFCGFAAPIACHTCRNFQPWLDGPHEAVLDWLLQERDSLTSRGADLRIASVNDRTILAVADVVRRCNTIKTAKTS